MEGIGLVRKPINSGVLKYDEISFGEDWGLDEKCIHTLYGNSAVRGSNVLIPMNYDQIENKASIRSTYLDAIGEVGFTPTLVDPRIPLVEFEKLYAEASIDAIMLIGGLDIDPINYGESVQSIDMADPERFMGSQDKNLVRDNFELYLAQKALKENIPLLGICRGHQIFGVALGAKIDQHIGWGHLPESGKYSDLPLSKHEIEITDPELERIVGKNKMEVNSGHHQALNKASLRKVGITPSALSEGDGVVEAIFPKNYRFVLGMQSHPEAMIDPFTGKLNESSRKIFKAFADSARLNSPRQKNMTNSGL